MMRKKKGVSPLIATVLLVGFSVALAAIVSTFVIKETKKFNAESFLEESPFCENLAVELTLASGKQLKDVRIKDEQAVDAIEYYTLEAMGIKNKGSFTVQRYLVKSAGTEYPIIPDKEAREGKPGQITTVAKVNGISFAKKGDSADYKIVIQPAVRDPEKEKVIPCPKQEISVNYKDVCCNIKECGDNLATTAPSLSGLCSA